MSREKLLVKLERADSNVSYKKKEIYSGKDLRAAGVEICKSCIYDETIPGIQFNEKGICNYCKMIENLCDQYCTGGIKGKKLLQRIVEEIKRVGDNRKYDCVVGVSGGTDSSYTLYKAVEMGLRPLAVHYDNTWNSAIATENIRKITNKFGVDLYTYVVDNKEADDILRSAFFAGVPDLDAATDIAITEVLYRAANEFKINYILEGHSFTAEGVSPLGNAYFDGKYVSDIHRKYGRMKMKTFPNMGFWKFIYWILIKRIKKVRPLWYLKYSKEAAQKLLSNKCGWQYYGGHHLENRIAAFSHSYYLPFKFKIDQRNNALSAAVRNGILTRDEALAEYAKAPYIEEDLIQYFKKRIGISDSDFENIMKGPKRSYKDFKTYKKRFERMRPFFFLLAKANLVPMSFYIKYTSKSEI